MNSRFLERVDVTGLVLTVAVTIAWAAFGSRSAAASVAIGGALALLNMILIRQVLGGVVRRMSAGDPQSPMLAGLFIAKFAALALVIYLMVAVAGVSAMPLAVGMSLVPLAILVEFVRWTINAPPTEPTAGT